MIDGDTIVLEGVNTQVRYLAIDAPEIPTEESPGDPLSLEAKRFNESLVGGKTVRLEFDEEKYDYYGRMLAYVYVDELFVNQEMVRSGLARAFIIKPNDKHERIIYEAEEQARRGRKGIWGDHRGFKPPDENVRFLIKPSQASRYIGQRVVVRGKITDFRKSDKVIVLEMENEMDVVIFSGDWGNFDFFGIVPEKYYPGKPVEVVGRVKMYRGKPQIVAGHPILIRELR
ncbi:MAG TPA: thermonuclease family protein [Thermodesulfobacteriota bacterium]|nr:thermonuclease family protein [Thermodesulfobacteriota bacterium]